MHQHIVLRRFFLRLVARKLQRALHIINDKAGDLRRQHAEIIGHEDKKNTDTQAQPVFAKIFIEGFEVLQSKSLGKGIAEAPASAWAFEKVWLNHNLKEGCKSNKKKIKAQT